VTETAKVKEQRKIVICGTGQGIQRAPFNKGGYEFWGLHGHWNLEQKFDRIYEVHSAKAMNDLNVPQAAADWLWKNITHMNPSLKKCFENAKEFDFDKYLDKYGKSAFSCSISWMLAEAIEEKPDVIEIYGVTLSGKDEYKRQKPSVYAFVMVARALGIKVVVDRESELFGNGWVYGFEDVPGYVVALRDKQQKIQREMFNAESEALEQRAKFNRLEGQNDMIDWMKDSYGV
jgi:hypothetical protein